MQNERPILGITIGDPAGIGPEITLKALQQQPFYSAAKPLVIGSSSVLEHVLNQNGLPLALNVVDSPADGLYTYGTVDVMDVDNIDVTSLQMGVVQKQCGQACFEYIRRATELAMNHQIDAIVTAPINKEAIKAASVPYIGHTEMFADLTKAKREMTMFSIENVKIFFLTRHLSLVDACNKINNNPEFVLQGIRQSYEVLTTLLESKPRMAVAGLNPHSGEGGILGMEEINAIRPAVMLAKSEGLNVTGPVPADSVFHFARTGQYDAVLSLYHDQGHIAAKMIDFEKTVSVTLGLPILRTSVDHGTAYDIAGKGIASPVSMMEAIRTAAIYVSKYKVL